MARTLLTKYPNIKFYCDIPLLFEKMDSFHMHVRNYKPVLVFRNKYWMNRFHLASPSECLQEKQSKHINLTMLPEAGMFLFVCLYALIFKSYVFSISFFPACCKNIFVLLFFCSICHCICTTTGGHFQSFEECTLFRKFWKCRKIAQYGTIQQWITKPHKVNIKEVYG